MQAVALFAVCLGLLCLGFVPLTTDEFQGSGGQVLSVIAVQVALVGACWICARKGKYRLVLLAIFIFPVAFVGAVRLARPGSPWYRRHYIQGSAKQRRALTRARRFDQRWGARWTSLADLIAGAPDQS